MNLKPYKPYQLTAIVNWLYDSECTPFIMVNASEEPGVELPLEQAHEGKVMFNLMQEMIEDWIVQDDWVRFSVVIGSQSQAVAFPIDDVISIHCLENGWHYLFDENQDDDSDQGEESAESALTCIQGQAPYRPNRARSTQTKRVLSLIG